MEGSCEPPCASSSMRSRDRDKVPSGLVEERNAQLEEHRRRTNHVHIIILLRLQKVNHADKDPRIVLQGFRIRCRTIYALSTRIYSKIARKQLEKHLSSFDTGQRQAASCQY